MAISSLAKASAAFLTILFLGVSMPSEAAPKVVKKLLWSQEFVAKAGTTVDPKFWNFDLGDGTNAGIPGWGNQEREYYIPGAVKHDGKSNLVITATRMPVSPNGQVSAANPYFCYYGTACEWTSGKIHTAGKLGFKYGRMEARIKMPSGIGTWPAFWMLGSDLGEVGWPHSGEIDIMEGKGSQPKLSYGTVHGPGYSGGEAISGLVKFGKTTSAAYNNYAIEWKPDQIKWLINDKVFFTVNKKDVGSNAWVFNHEFYLILNLAIGGQFTGEVDPDLKKATMTVDWIRYYSINGVGELTKYPAGADK